MFFRLQNKTQHSILQMKLGAGAKYLLQTELLASKCLSIYQQSIQETLQPLSNARACFTPLEQNPTFNIDRKLGTKPCTLFKREVSVSRRSSFYRQPRLETLRPLSSARMFYTIRTKPNIQHRQEIRSANQLRYRYRTRPGLTALKPNPNFNRDIELGEKANYLL